MRAADHFPNRVKLPIVVWDVPEGYLLLEELLLPVLEVREIVVGDQNVGSVVQVIAVAKVLNSLVLVLLTEDEVQRAHLLRDRTGHLRQVRDVLVHRVAQEVLQQGSIEVDQLDLGVVTQERDNSGHRRVALWAEVLEIRHRNS